MTSESTPFLMLRNGACEIYLIRHGDATPTEGEIISNTYDEQPLNSRGRAQAEALARHLATVPIAALYSSPLRRALDTAQPLAAVKALPVEIVPDVREIVHSADIERSDGMSTADYIKLFKEGGSYISAHMMRVGSFEGLPGAEPRAHFRRRVRDALDVLGTRHPGQRIAVIAHGGVINVFTAEVLGLRQDVFMAVPNTAISRFRLQGSRRQLVALNDTCHLRDLARTT